MSLRFVPNKTFVFSAAWSSAWATIGTEVCLMGIVAVSVWSGEFETESADLIGFWEGVVLGFFSYGILAAAIGALISMLAAIKGNNRVGESNGSGLFDK
jgi:hypothetical protein